MFFVIINIADNIFEKWVCLLLLSHLFFLYQTLSIFFNLRKLTHKYVHPSPPSPHREGPMSSLVLRIIFGQIQGILMSSSIFFSASSFHCSLFYSSILFFRSHHQQSTDYFLDLKPEHQWQNSENSFWFYASLLRPPRKDLDTLKNKNSSFLLGQNFIKAVSVMAQKSRKWENPFLSVWFFATEAKWPWGSSGSMFPFHGVAHTPPSFTSSCSPFSSSTTGNHSALPLQIYDQEQAVNREDQS